MTERTKRTKRTKEDSVTRPVGKPFPEDTETTGQALVASVSAGEEGVTLEERQQDKAVVERVEHLTQDMGWVLVMAGVVGIIVPGVLGMPFLIMGALVLWPGTRERVQHWWEGQPPKFLHGSMKQINRFLDDLERRYPRIERR